MALVEPMLRRLVQRVVPRYMAVAQRVAIKRLLWNEEEEQVLTLKYVASYTGRLGEFCELYAFCFNGTDVEILLSIIPTNNEYLLEISRSTVAPLEVYVDDALKGTFPELADTTTPSIGYMAIIIA